MEKHITISDIEQGYHSITQNTEELEVDVISSVLEQLDIFTEGLKIYPLTIFL